MSVQLIYTVSTFCVFETGLTVQPKILLPQSLECCHYRYVLPYLTFIIAFVTILLLPVHGNVLDDTLFNYSPTSGHFSIRGSHCQFSNERLISSVKMSLEMPGCMRLTQILCVMHLNKFGVLEIFYRYVREIVWSSIKTKL